MGRVISFEDHAVAQLRDRLGAAETARADLLAFARGHSEAVATIHHAVLHALASDSAVGMLESMARDWPEVLEVDFVAIAMRVGKQAFLVDRRGITHLDPAMLKRVGRSAPAVSRTVERGHALFGHDAPHVRSEALIPIGRGGDELPAGLLLLGHCSAVGPGSVQGAQLLEFLGQFLAAMMQRWLNLAPTNQLTRRVP